MADLLGISELSYIPFFQGIYDSKEERFSGYEVLIRLKLGNNYLYPKYFIDKLEKSENISKVFKDIILSIRKITHHFTKNCWFIINITPELLDSVKVFNLLKELNFPLSGNLHFELTERTPFINWDTAKKNMDKLISHGYDFKIDDFGCGYNGFLNILKLNIKNIKIDKTFIQTIGGSNEKILNSILCACQTGGLEVIAEGIEDQHQYITLKEKGVRYFQGYLFSKPEPIY
ncbi:EAL domain-containing protein [Vibrio parahaemolyticus]|uniref:EAL domain-containing protein n=1 Tax=Vibrio parahaemolyticus TaxID=670 RepID=UPI00226A1633|nr:EAL domain-containing protein [Vibrio parahaemolyticus]MCX8764207.1 EAL domain-containing protein [Vibrio parahaemolyticus]